MWSLYRCPHCQAINTGKAWSLSTLTHSVENGPIEFHKPNAELVCPSCEKKILTNNLITLWEFWHVAS